MASAINALVPAANAALSSAQIRALALAAKTEIEALQRSYGTAETVGRALTAADLSKTILYNSAAAGSFTIPTDAVLGITGSDEARFRIVQLGTGAVSIVGASGVTNNNPTDIPPAIQFSTEVATRYGVSTYLGTRV